MDDDWDGFLDFLALRPRPLRAPDIEPDGDPSEMYLLPVEDVPTLPSCADESACLHALSVRFPDAHKGTLERLVKAGARHVEAALRHPMPKRVLQTLRILLREQGRANSDLFVREDGQPMKGNNANVTELRDEGFFINEEKITTHEGFKRSLFSLDFTRFNDTACRRSSLSAGQRKALLERDHHQCKVCGSVSDLEIDHRVGLKQGATNQNDLDSWQILCRGCNRNKRTACGQCPLKDPVQCFGAEQRCFWSSPDDHTHRAGDPGMFVMLSLGEKARKAAVEAGLSPREWALSKCS